MTDATHRPTTDAANANPYRRGDPVMDAAQGRAMIVLDAPEQTVAEWSDANNYELTENYANEKFGAADEEYVVECVYVSDVRSEPSKTYTFPASRCRLIDAHHADDGRRVGARVIQDLAIEFFRLCLQRNEQMEAEWARESLKAVGVESDLVDEAYEVADADVTLGTPEVDE
jgi:endogenous inhibitor of DNA gyrase (YacG/DUF329 family)